MALIGCGFTGTSAFFQLVDRFPVKEVTIFEASGRFGPGYPYNPAECPDYLLNNTADTLCLVPSNRRAFLSWIESQPDLAAGFGPKSHPPRAAFGRFLQDAFKATCVAAAVKGVRVNAIPAEATRLSEAPDGSVTLGWAGGEVRADVAILTTGRCPALDRTPTPPTGSRARLIADHVMSDAFEDLPLDAEVHILGASLSAYDVINRLFSDKTGCRFERGADGALAFVPGPNQRRVALCSRSGRLKQAQSQHPMKLARRHFSAAAFPGAVTLESLAAAILREASDHGADIDWTRVSDPYRGCASPEDVVERAGELLSAAVRSATDPEGRNFLVDLFADAQREIWDVWARRPLSPAQEIRYREQLESAVLTASAPCPAETAERLLALLRAGRLRVLKGVGAPRLTGSGDAYLIPHAFGEERATVLVNAAGRLDRDPASQGQPPLIRSLAQGGLLRPDGRAGLGADVDMENFRARGARSVYLANMFLWGPGFFTSSAFMMASVAQRLLEGLYGVRSHQ